MPCRVDTWWWDDVLVVVFVMIHHNVGVDVVVVMIGVVV